MDKLGKHEDAISEEMTIIASLNMSLIDSVEKYNPRAICSKSNSKESIKRKIIMIREELLKLSGLL